MIPLPKPTKIQVKIAQLILSPLLISFFSIDFLTIPISTNGRRPQQALQFFFSRANNELRNSDFWPVAHFFKSFPPPAPLLPRFYVWQQVSVSLQTLFWKELCQIKTQKKREPFVVVPPSRLSHLPCTVERTTNRAHADMIYHLMLPRNEETCHGTH